MKQTTLSMPEEDELHYALAKCPTCDHTIPKSCNVCLWCGAKREGVK